MKVDEFDYYLPDELIAQQPVKVRDESRLMVLKRKSAEIIDKRFRDIIEYLNKGDLLVLNNSKVIPARLYGKKIPTGTEIEVLLLNEKEKDIWEVLVRPGKRVRKGVEISFANGRLLGKTLESTDFGGRIMRFSYSGNFEEIIKQTGELPLPPYITEKLEDPQRYQTIYAREQGSVAAPTAGLHFTKELLEEIQEKGVGIAYLTLHVGLGTFRPVKAENIEEHQMHSEYYELSTETAELINKTKEEGKRIVAVGTTSTRTLESIMARRGKIEAHQGWTDIFIYPGFEFKVIDGLVTNFHLPKSTLLMLVSAFASRERILNAYNYAVKKEYRFFSLGDAMLIV